MHHPMRNKGRFRVPPESETVEWKQSLGEWKEIVETCAAFASSQGGTIYVGIDPKGDCVGIEVGKGSLEDLANKIKINTDPPQFPSIEINRPTGVTTLEIHVEQNPVKPAWAFGRPLKRVGRTNQFLRRDEAQRMLERSSGRTWDTLTCPGFTIKDVDKTVLKDYLSRAGMNLSTPFDAVFRNLRFPFTPSAYCNAAVLLFGKDPQSFYIEAQLKCGRFKGTDSVEFEDEHLVIVSRFSYHMSV